MPNFGPVTYKPSIKRIQLVKDWLGLLRVEMTRRGFAGADDTAAIPEHEVDIRYFAASQRQVRQVPRTVHVASTLRVPQGLENGYDMVKEKIRTGADLTPHLSKQSRKAKFDDGFLNDWGLQHLHLGTTVGSDGFVERTGPLLIVRFVETDAYLIAIQDHQKWGNQDLLETLLREWPSVLEPARRARLRGGGQNPTAEELIQARRAGVQPLLTLSDGQVYGPLGGGLSTARVSMRAVFTARDWRRRIRALQTAFDEQLVEVAQRAEEAGIHLPAEVSLKLVTQEKQLCVLVEECRVFCMTGLEFPPA